MMGENRQEDGLELDQDLDYQVREWRVQRCAWAVFVLVLIMALAGLFGAGPLSRASAGSSADGLRLQYDRIAHHGSDIPLHFALAPGGRSEVRLWISRDFVQGVEINDITPQPERVEAGDNRLTYTFKTAASAGETSIVFLVNPRLVGYRSGQFSMGDRPAVRFHQIVLP